MDYRSDKMYQKWLGQLTPGPAARPELLETLKVGMVMTFDQLAELLDVPLEHLEMNAVKAGLFTCDDEGNLHPTAEALRNGMVVSRAGR